MRTVFVSPEDIAEHQRYSRAIGDANGLILGSTMLAAATTLMWAVGGAAPGWTLLATAAVLVVAHVRGWMKLRALQPSKISRMVDAMKWPQPPSR